MKTLLRIDSSSRVNGSHSRKLADYLEASWKNQYPEGKVIYRDLITQSVPHIANNTIEGFYTSPELQNNQTKSALSLSNTLIRELKSVDEILISSPLYNLNVPSALKAYFDQIVRVEHTFTVDQNGVFRGLIEGKKAYLVLVKGGVYANTPMEELDFQIPYLKTILNYIGIADQTIFSLEGTSHPHSLEKNLRKIHHQINHHFKLQTVKP